MSVLDKGDYKQFAAGYRAGLKDAWEQAQRYPEALKGTYEDLIAEQTILKGIARHFLKGVRHERDNTDGNR